MLFMLLKYWTLNQPNMLLQRGPEGKKRQQLNKWYQQLSVGNRTWLYFFLWIFAYRFRKVRSESQASAFGFKGMKLLFPVWDASPSQCYPAGWREAPRVIYRSIRNFNIPSPFVNKHMEPSNSHPRAKIGTQMPHLRELKCPYLVKKMSNRKE